MYNLLYNFYMKTLVKKRYISFKKLFIVFLVISLFGNIYEIVLNFIKELITNNRILLETRQGLILTPITPVYGLGAVIMTLCFQERKLKWYQIFIIGCVVGGAFEFLFSLLEEKIFGTVSWDYSNHFLNFDGRTSVPVMIVWGLMSLIFIKLIYPLFCKLFRVIPKNTFSYVVYYSLLLFISFDTLLSFTASIRRNLRDKGKPPYTFIGEICDRLYPNDVLDKIFPAKKE